MKLLTSIRNFLKDEKKLNRDEAVAEIYAPEIADLFIEYLKVKKIESPLPMQQIIDAWIGGINMEKANMKQKTLKSMLEDVKVGCPTCLHPHNLSSKAIDSIVSMAAEQVKEAKPAYKHIKGFHSPAVDASQRAVDIYESTALHLLGEDV